MVAFRYVEFVQKFLCVFSDGFEFGGTDALGGIQDKTNVHFSLATVLCRKENCGVEMQNTE